MRYISFFFCGKAKRQTEKRRTQKQEKESLRVVPLDACFANILMTDAGKDGKEKRK